MKADNDIIKLALDDARARQTALVQLMYFTDQQALGLLRLYVTLGTASATAAVTGFSSNSWLPVEGSAALLACTTTFLAGSYFCFRAMRTAEVTLPGRGADFWKDALFANFNQAEIVSQYLDGLISGQHRDKATNKTSASALRLAKWAGISTPLVAIIVALLTVLTRHYHLSEYFSL